MSVANYIMSFMLPINTETEKAHIDIVNRKIEMAGGKIVINEM